MNFDIQLPDTLVADLGTTQIATTAAKIDSMRVLYFGEETPARYLLCSIAGDIYVYRPGVGFEKAYASGKPTAVWNFEVYPWGVSALSPLGYPGIYALARAGTEPVFGISLLGSWTGILGKWKNAPRGNMLRSWKNRMIVAGHGEHPLRLFYSEIGDPEKPEGFGNGGYGGNFIDVRLSESDSEPITWLEVLDDALIVFKKKAVCVFLDDSTFAFDRVSQVGCEGRFQSCVIGGRVYWVTREGVLSTSTAGDVRLESQNIEPVFDQTYPDVQYKLKARLSDLAIRARMSVMPEGRIALALPSLFDSTGGCRHLYIGYPLLRKAGDPRNPVMPWTIHQFWDRRVSALAVYRESDSDVDKLVAGLQEGTPSTPSLAKLFTGTSYEGQGGASSGGGYYRCGWKGFITDEPFERLRRVNMLMRGKIEASAQSDAQVFPATPMESGSGGTNTEEVRIRPETWGRFHRIALAPSTMAIQAVILKGELVFRGGKEHT